MSVLVATPRLFRQHGRHPSTIQRVSLVERTVRTLTRGDRAAPLPLGAVVLALLGGAVVGAAAAKRRP